jgi:regulator of RNase E activity RraA
MEGRRSITNDWHQNKASGPFLHIMRPGSVMVIDDAPGTDSGTVNSNNVLNWATRGCVGVVTTGGVRDSDEIMTQKMPVYFSKPGRGLRAGRVELESVNRAVVVGGACVMPGDVIVADGDGVVMVPRVYAEKVARYAQRVRYQDRENRRALYEQLALPNDVSVR